MRAAEHSREGTGEHGDAGDAQRVDDFARETMRLCCSNLNARPTRRSAPRQADQRDAAIRVDAMAMQFAAIWAGTTSSKPTP